MRKEMPRQQYFKEKARTLCVEMLSNVRIRENRRPGAAKRERSGVGRGRGKGRKNQTSPFSRLVDARDGVVKSSL